VSFYPVIKIQYFIQLMFFPSGGIVDEVTSDLEPSPAVAVPKVKIKLTPGAMVATPVTSEKRKRKKSRKLYTSDDEEQPMEEIPEEEVSLQ